MSTKFTLKCIWLFILGAVLAVIGLYTLLTRPDMGSNPFIIMLMGLFFTGAGSVYGKKKLMEGEPAISSPGDQGPQRYQFRSQQPERSYEDYPYSEMPERQAPRQQALPATEIARAPETRTETTEDFLEIAEDSMETVPPAASPAKAPVSAPQAKTEIQAMPKTSKILRIIVCPKCGAENQGNDRFCYSCGKKLKTERKKPVNAKPPVKAPVKKKPAAKKPKIITKKPAAKTAVVDMAEGNV